MGTIDDDCGSSGVVVVGVDTPINPSNPTFPGVLADLPPDSILAKSSSNLPTNSRRLSFSLCTSSSFS